MMSKFVEYTLGYQKWSGGEIVIGGGLSFYSSFFWYKLSIFAETTIYYLERKKIMLIIHF